MRMQLSNLFRPLSLCVILNWLLIPFLPFQSINFTTIKAVYKEPNGRSLRAHTCAAVPTVRMLEPWSSK